MGFMKQKAVMLVLCAFATAIAEELPIVVEEDFENGRERWVGTDDDLEKPVWEMGEADGNHFLRVTGKSKYKPLQRSPHSICWLKDVVVGDFDLTVKIQNTRPKAGAHRDLCLFWGGRDPEHFYYVHFGAKPDPHSCQIFIVNEAPRKMITENETKGTPWENRWHTVRVKRRVADGLIEVYFDDMETPRMVAHDKTFVSGRIGLGTFDDHGNFDDLELRGVVVESKVGDE